MSSDQEQHQREQQEQQKLEEEKQKKEGDNDQEKDQETEKEEKKEKQEDQHGEQGDENVVTKGACFCKAVTFTLTGKPQLCVYCHCTLCQRITGAPFVMESLWPSSAFHLDVPEQERAEKLSMFCTTEQLQRFHCKVCSAPVFNCRKDRDMVAVAVCVMERDDKMQVRALKTGLIKPTSHIFYGNRCLDVSDGLPKYLSFPGSQEMPETEKKGKCQLM